MPKPRFAMLTHGPGFLFLMVPWQSRRYAGIQYPRRTRPERLIADPLAAFGIEPMQGVLAIGANLDSFAYCQRIIFGQADRATQHNGCIAMSSMNQLLGPQDFDHFDLNGYSGCVQFDVLWAHSHDDLAVGKYRRNQCRIKREHGSIFITDAAMVIDLDRNQIHGRRANEARDKNGSRFLEYFDRCAYLFRNAFV